MESPAATAYRRCTLARCRFLAPAAESVDRPELFGELPGATHPHLRLTVLTDDALPRLTAAMRVGEHGIVAVAEVATACADLMSRQPGWRASDATAMGLPDIGAVPEVSWPDGLRLRPVRRTPDDDPAGVPLDDAVGLLDADGPFSSGDHAGLVGHLSGLRSTSLLAAVDDDGTVRATAGCGVFGTSAHVIFVNTHPAWRRRGVAAAMTATALAQAAAAGAVSASLDASSAGRGPYERLGFTAVLRVRRFSRETG